MRRNQDRFGTRRYTRSESPRLRWTSELHMLFVEAIKGLGGENNATPKRILQMMGVRDLSISHIKSHLQMYRTMKNQINSVVFMPTRRSHMKRAQYGETDELSHQSFYKESRSISVSNISSSNQKPGMELNKDKSQGEPIDLNEKESEEGKIDDDPGGLCELTLSFDPSPLIECESSTEFGDENKKIGDSKTDRYEPLQGSYINLELTMSTHTLSS
ncbi:putative Myb family transcription factor [Acorus gramineus]|uniref:Myb family transcription factor n=1 Tax=Acorus gramineus TaxID=55184 RepID=A0AAV9BWM9_ACOGR|nr:putative Myb family transcription factor [Acorus gramineus]